MRCLVAPHLTVVVVKASYLHDGEYSGKRLALLGGGGRRYDLRNKKAAA